MRVGIDLDGVCYDFAASVREFVTSAGIRFRHQCPDPTRWEFYEDWGMDLPEFLTACHRGVEAGTIFTHGEPYPGTRDALNAMKANGHTLHVITDRAFGRSGASEAATRAWLDAHRLPFDSLTFTADKTIVRVDAMIDDKPANYDALNAAGVQVWMMDRPWNAAHPATRRVSTLAEFAEVIA